MNQPLAHSARPKRGITAQPYAEHVANVFQQAVRNARAIAGYSPQFGERLVRAVKVAAEFHDLGKLDEANQAVLRSGNPKQSLPVNHVDAGVAHLFDPTVNDLLAAALVYAHHIGLPDFQDQRQNKSGFVLRDCAPAVQGLSTKEVTDERIKDYLQAHRSAFQPNEDRAAGPTVANSGRPLSAAKLAMPPMVFRLALSCLVDADHTDTARNYGDPIPSVGQALEPKQRLERLDQYVRGLNTGKTDDRTRMRVALYDACRNATVPRGLVACDSPVGSGKTTAVMAHLLRVAAEYGLRRVFVVLPFTNIIDQSVDVYRRALPLPAENPTDIVAAHHHRAEFENPASRQFAFLWHAPAVVTTAVQFFETLAAKTPAALRKLHQVPGSAIFIDESHTALPSHLWTIAWLWLRELQENWGCHIVFGSGSLNRFWELPDFVEWPASRAVRASCPISLPQLVHNSVRSMSAEFEDRRIKYQSHAELLDLNRLAAFLSNCAGPRLLIVNTVQSAAAIARDLAKRFTGERVEHLSTALSPRDRKAILELVKLRLQQTNHRDWTLVATSCVEAGVDVSFRTGIRERCSLTSLLQTAGRVNRSNGYNEAVVWDIQLRHDHLLRPHPAFETSARILGELFAERDESGRNKVSPDYCTEALLREIRQDAPKAAKGILLKAECDTKFPMVEKLFRVIDTETVTAVVDGEIMRKLDEGEPVSRDELQAASVQIWHGRVREWGMREFDWFPGLFAWHLPYHNFLGYMAGVLPLVDARNSVYMA